jgi:Predicted inhibitor of MCP methylation, homolog of CheC
MEPGTERVLKSVASEVLEGLAFVSADGSVQAEAENVKKGVAIVRFSGPFSGELTVAAPEETVCELAMNMLGLETGEDCSEQAKADALGEVANVICGNLVAAIGGPQAVFDLEKPQVVFAEPGEGAKLEAAPGERRVLLALETGWISISLRSRKRDATVQEGGEAQGQ